MQRRPAVIAQLTTPKALGGFRAGLGDAPGIVAIRPATGESLNIYGYRIDDRKSHRRPEYERAFAKVAAVPGLSTPPVPPRLVSLLWYIPLFMHWQVARINDNGGDLSHYRVAITAMTAEVERILGVP